MLSDRGNEVASRFGLTFKLPDYMIAIYKSFPLILPDFNGDDSWSLPIPARFVVSQDGIVRAADVDPDYTRRPEPAATIEVLRGIAATRS